VRSPDATAKLHAEQEALESALKNRAVSEIRTELEKNRRQQQTGSGVRSPAAAAKLRQQEEELEARQGAAMGGPVISPAPAMFRPPGAQGPAINWQAGAFGQRL
jgi:hypothetical protein